MKIKSLKKIKTIERSNSFNEISINRNYLKINEINNIYKNYFKDICLLNKINDDDINILHNLKSYSKMCIKNKKIERLKLQWVPSFLFKNKFVSNLYKKEKDYNQIDKICKDIFMKIKNINFKKKIKIEHKNIKEDKNRKPNLNKSMKFIKTKSKINDSKINIKLNLIKKKSSILYKKPREKIKINKNFIIKKYKSFNQKKFKNNKLIIKKDKNIVNKFKLNKINFIKKSLYNEYLKI